MKSFFAYFTFTGCFGFAQSDLSWQGYFSYSEIKDVSQTASAFLSSENACSKKFTTT
jgi:hypothetical protein